MTPEQIEAAIARQFNLPGGREAMQAILEHAGVFAAEPMGNDDLQRETGARALALDIATMAGLLPEVSGLVVEPPAARAAEAVSGQREPGGEPREEADA